MRKIITCIAVALTVLAVFAACQAAKTTPPSTKLSVDTYLGAGNYGDLIVYTIDRDERTISYSNETTGHGGGGTFKVLDGTYDGIYETSINGDPDKYYTIEIPGKIAITSVPSGNPNNRLVYSVCNEADLSTVSAASTGGLYSWLYVPDRTSDYGVSVTWGGYEVSSDVSVDSPVKKYKYTWGRVPDTLKPENVVDFNEYFAGAPPWTGPSNIGGEGVWYVQNNRVKMEDIRGSAGALQYTGIILPGRIMLIDQGPTLGFALGFKYPSSHVTLNDIAGTYKYLEVVFNTDSTCSIGKYILNPSGTSMAVYYIPDAHMEGTTDIDSITAVANVNNLFKMFITNGAGPGQDLDLYYFIMDDGIAMGFSVFASGPNTGKILSILVGARTGT